MGFLRSSALICIVVTITAIDLRVGFSVPGRGAPPDAFSALRAIDETHALLPIAAPHPVGSPANRLVRDRIVSRFQNLGYQVRMNAGTACSPISKIQRRESQTL